MKTILIKLRPAEPFFFGGERNYDYGEKSGDRNRNQMAGASYFVRSLETPSQTTLFGTLRYLLKQDNGFEIGANDGHIGRYSYNLIDSGQTFNKINGISPLYIMDGNGEFFIKTPFDHMIRKLKLDPDKKPEYYTPFKNYDSYITGDGEKLLPSDYDAKDGIADGYMRVSDKMIFGNIIKSVEKVGINKRVQGELREKRSDGASLFKDSFFKKEYKCFDTPDKCFAFFAYLADDSPKISKTHCYLGQAKSMFTVEIADEAKKPETRLKQTVENTFDHDIAYALSDIYIGCEPAELYKCCSFINIKTKYFRVFTTNHAEKGGHLTRFERGNERIRLITAGSVFIPSDADKFKKSVYDSHADIAGFNKIIYGGNLK